MALGNVLYARTIAGEPLNIALRVNWQTTILEFPQYFTPEYIPRGREEKKKRNDYLHSQD